MGEFETGYGDGLGFKYYILLPGMLLVLHDTFYCLFICTRDVISCRMKFHMGVFVNSPQINSFLTLPF